MLYKQNIQWAFKEEMCVSCQQNNMSLKGSSVNRVGTVWPTVYFLCFLAIRHGLCSAWHAAFTDRYLHRDCHVHQRQLHLYNTRMQLRTETNASTGNRCPFWPGSRERLTVQKQGQEEFNWYGRKSLPWLLICSSLSSDTRNGYLSKAMCLL